MEQAMNRPTPGWAQRFINFRWYEWIGWLVELGIVGTFIVVIHTQFAEGEPKAGWIAILLTILLCGPGVWLLLGYKPEKGSGFGKYDVGVIICFALWAAIMLYLVVPVAEFVPGPFGSPF